MTGADGELRSYGPQYPAFNNFTVFIRANNRGVRINTQLPAHFGDPTVIQDGIFYAVCRVICTFYTVRQTQFLTNLFVDSCIGVPHKYFVCFYIVYVT